VNEPIHNTSHKGRIPNDLQDQSELPVRSSHIDRILSWGSRSTGGRAGIPSARDRKLTVVAGDAAGILSRAFLGSDTGEVNRG
jgi:hypothetical protein